MTASYTNNLAKIDLSTVEKEVKAIVLTPPGREELQLALSCVDLTSLEGKDTEQTILELSEKAIKSGVAAVCVYPSLIKTAKAALINSSIKVASVAGGFPSGQLPLELKLEEVRYALKEGADEIDMVISRRAILQNDYEFTVKEVAAIKEICEKKTLKVILETGELETLENIALASRLAIEGGADFIKTSTGKISSNATFENVCVMLQEIKAHFEKTGQKIGIKPSGGIADGTSAVKYIRLIRQMLGEDWLKPSLFRIGASRLVSNLTVDISDLNLGYKTGEKQTQTNMYGY